MRLGQVVDDRFTIEAPGGSGGMGDVFRARDEKDGATVALKILRPGAERETERFAREIKILADLDAPGIVRYVAHGFVGERPYLAMEWLEGESLAARLNRAPLTAGEAVELGIQVAKALAVAHQKGVIHRDLKPNNLQLVDRDVAKVKVLDFGVAQFDGLGSTGDGLTRTGAIVGTVGYMSPEQARGDKGIDGRADLFSLGCVLFKCLSGRAVFHGDDVLAILLKVVIEEAPRLSNLRDDLPPALVDLVAAMLSKLPSERPSSAAAVAAALDALGHVEAGIARAAVVKPTLTDSEQRVLGVLLVQPNAFTATERAATIDAARAAALPFQGRLETLAAGLLAVTLTRTSGATDGASQAARCALALRAVLPHAAMSLATGRGLVDRSMPVGDAIDRAAELLRVGGGERKGIRLDEVTAGLLNPRFEVDGDRHGLILRGERDLAEAARTLLGKPTPFVGRDRELDEILGLVRSSFEESRPAIALVLGPPGAGKSRLRHELTARIRAEHGAATLWIGRGDPMRAGSAFGMIGPVVRREAGISDDEPLGVKQQKLRARVARHVDPAEAQRVGEFLGELAGVPFDPAASVKLAAARLDPSLMADQLRRAFDDFLAAETRSAPLVLVLDDLHWGDLPSVEYVDAALGQLGERPIFVLGLARPDVEEVFPRLWKQRGPHIVHLHALRKKGARELVRTVLGDGADAATVDRLVELSAGNAFYLEELIRAAAQGRGDRLPETVIAMVQARLASLDGEARRLLRAASVFGQVFDAGGIAALVDSDVASGTVQVDLLLGRLVEQEILARRDDASRRALDGYAFRHALLRDAAYAMLTEQDKMLGHRLAGEFLEQAGESDPLLLAEHHERGGARAKAADAYRRAAEDAREASDFAAAIARAERGLACGAGGRLRGVLLAIKAESHRWRGEVTEAEEPALDACTELPKGSIAWYAACGEVAMSSGRLGHVDERRRLEVELEAAEPEPGAEGARWLACERSVVLLRLAGLLDEAARLAAHIAPSESRLEHDPFLRARLLHARADRGRIAGDNARYVEMMIRAVDAYDATGHERDSASARMSVGYGLVEMGCDAEGERWLREALAIGARMNLWQTRAEALHNLGPALARVGRPAEAITAEREAVAVFAAQGDRLMEGASLAYLSLILKGEGDLDAAERPARRALVLLASWPTVLCLALAAMADIELARGNAKEALALVREGMTTFEALKEIEAGEALLGALLAECLLATGDEAGARGAAKAAEARLFARAAKITREDWRSSFLEKVPDNARVLAIAARVR